jgi:hypothetical protein
MSNDVRLLQHRNLRPERVLILVMLAVTLPLCVANFLYNPQDAVGWAGLVFLALLCGFIFPILPYRWRGRFRKQVACGLQGFSSQQTLGKIRRWKAWPQHSFLSVNVRENKWPMLRLVERDYAATSAAGQIERTLAHVFLRMNRQLYRNVEIGKRLRNEATGQPASVADADVQSCTHCPDCGYRQMTSSRVCPECGWTNDAADVVLFGRNGPQASGSALRRNRRSLRARWSVIVLLGGHVLVFVLTAFASTKLQNSPLLPSLYLLLVAIVFLLASTWGLAWFLRSIESKAEKEERAINVAEGPAGEIVLRLQAAGFAQHLVGRRGVPLQAYDKGSRWRVTRWPGGLRVRCDRVGVRPGKRNENRPVDFVCNAAEPRAAVQEIRRRLGILLA